MRKSIVFVFLALVACGSPPATTNSSAHYAAMSTSQLWSQHLLNRSHQEVSFVEAELGARGETAYGSRYLGQSTASAYGNAIYSRLNGGQVSSGKNCSDFPSPAAAQKFFLASGGPKLDPHNLDGDGDGLACGWGKIVTKAYKSGAYKATAAKRSSTRRTSRACYVGPRGGTYTITASGRKNYGGC